MAHIPYNYTLVNHFVSEDPILFEYRTPVAQVTPPLKSAKGMIYLGAECSDKFDKTTAIRLCAVFGEFNIILEIGDQIG